MDVTLWILYALGGAVWFTAWVIPIGPNRHKLADLHAVWLAKGTGIERVTLQSLLYSLNWALVLCTPLWPVLLVFVFTDHVVSAVLRKRLSAGMIR